MKNLDKELILNSMDLYEKLAVYGIDKFNTKEDLMVLFFLKEILENNCHYNLLSQDDFSLFQRVITDIKNNNPSFKYCRFIIDSYKNLGGKQNIRTYQIIK